MVDDDASTDLALKATKTPVLGADYYVEPYSDQDIDIEIAEFIQYNLFEGLNTPFLTVLEEALECVTTDLVSSRLCTRLANGRHE